MYGCHSILEWYNMDSWVKLSIRSFCFISGVSKPCTTSIIYFLTMIDTSTLIVLRQSRKNLSKGINNLRMLLSYLSSGLVKRDFETQLDLGLRITDDAKVC